MKSFALRTMKSKSTPLMKSKPHGSDEIKSTHRRRGGFHLRKVISSSKMIYSTRKGGRCEEWDLILALRRSVARGSDTPLGCHSLPLVSNPIIYLHKKFRITLTGNSEFLVRGMGFEPTQTYVRYPLKVVRLPIPPPSHIFSCAQCFSSSLYIISDYSALVNRISEESYQHYGEKTVK